MHPPLPLLFRLWVDWSGTFSFHHKEIIMLLPFIPPCTITPAAEVSAVHESQSHLIEYRIEKPEIDHGYDEGRFDTVLLESRYIDVSSPFITGAIHEESPLLQVANHIMEKWWASTPLGRRLDVDRLLRDLRREQLRTSKWRMATQTRLGSISI